MIVQTRYDSKRGCGWRQPGGLYLIAGGVSAPCGLLPIPLTTCPTCSCGIKPSRGWTWLDIRPLVKNKACRLANHCPSCPVANQVAFGERQGLLWIGGSFYKHPEDWTNETIRQGISRRLSAVPRDFELGKTWVLVAHREALSVACPDCVEEHCDTCKDTRLIPQAAIFHAFKPTAIEYVVRGDETDEELQRLMNRGITPVKVIRVDENNRELPEVEEDEDEDETVIETEDERAPQFDLFN